MKRFTILDAYKAAMFLCFLQSMLAWFLYGKICLTVSFLIGLGMILPICIQWKTYLEYKNKYIWTIFILLVLELYIQRDGNYLSWGIAVFKVIIIIVFLCLKKEYKIQLLDYFTKGFALIITISLFFWILFLLNCPLPHNILLLPTEKPLDNYYFFIRIIAFDDLRFQSIFLEPGHLGTIGALLVVANQFKIRSFYVAVVLLGTLLSFSLAGFILLGVGYTTTLHYRKIFNILLVGLPLLFVVRIYNDGDNIINDYLFKRLEMSDSGGIKGNNRTDIAFDYYFEDEFLANCSVAILGIGRRTLDKLHEEGLKVGNGYKVFLVLHGFTGLLLLLLFYLSLIEKFNFASMSLFLVYALSFMQRIYSLWECQIFIFICGCTIAALQTKYQKIKKADLNNENLIHSTSPHEC